MTDWRDIEGWLSPAEGAALQTLAVGARVLEIGSYKGRSTTCLAAVARVVVAVDWHRGDGGCGFGDTLAEFLHNLTAHGVRDRVVPVVARVEAACPHLAPASFDVAFVDDAHDAVSVERSTHVALKCVKPGGVVAWHDWNFPEVVAGVRACGVEPAGFRGELAWLRLPERPAPPEREARP